MSYVIEGDDAELLVIVTNPTTGEFTMHGAGGHGNEISVFDAERIMAEARAKGDIPVLLVVWPSNADGRVQIESRDLQDVYEGMTE